MCQNHTDSIRDTIDNELADIGMPTSRETDNLRLIGLLEAFEIITSVELPNHFYQGGMATPGKVRHFIRNTLAARINELRPYPAIPL